MSSDGYSGAIFRGRRRGVLLALSSPSGAGKTTLSKRLLSQNPDVVLSVSATTRKPRPGEVDGQDYHFISVDEFKKKIEDDEFFEWAEVFGRYYGTPKTPVMEAVEDGRDVVFDIDWQGAQALAAAAPDDTVRVFILPPSIALLEDRLRKRGQDTPEIIKGRMARAKDEISAMTTSLARWKSSMRSSMPSDSSACVIHGWKSLSTRSWISRADRVIA